MTYGTGHEDDRHPWGLDLWIEHAVKVFWRWLWKPSKRCPCSRCRFSRTGHTATLKVRTVEHDHPIGYLP